MNRDVEIDSFDDDCVIIEKPAPKTPEYIQLDSDDDIPEANSKDHPDQTSSISTSNLSKMESKMNSRRNGDPLYYADPFPSEEEETPNMCNFPTSYLQRRFREHEELVKRLTEKNRLKHARLDAMEKLQAAEAANKEYDMPSSTSSQLYESWSPSYSQSPDQTQQQEQVNGHSTVRSFSPREDAMASKRIEKSRLEAPVVESQEQLHHRQQSSGSASFYGIKTNRDDVFNIREESSKVKTLQQFLASNKSRLPIGSRQSNAEITEDEQCDEEIRIVFDRNLHLRENGKDTAFVSGKSPQPTLHIQQHAVRESEISEGHKKYRDRHASEVVYRRDSGNSTDSHSTRYRHDSRRRDVEYQRHRQDSESSRTGRRGERRLQEDHSRYSSHNNRDRGSGFRRTPVENCRSDGNRRARSPPIESTSQRPSVSELCRQFEGIRAGKRGIEEDNENSTQPLPKRRLTELTEEQRELLIANGIPDLREIEAGTASYIKSDISVLSAKEIEELARLRAITEHARSQRGTHPIPLNCTGYVAKYLDEITRRSGCRKMRIGRTKYSNRYRYVHIRGEAETIENARRELDEMCLEKLEDEYEYNVKHHRTNSYVYYCHYIPEKCIAKMRTQQEYREACRRAALNGVQLSHQMHPSTEEDNPPMEMRGLACAIRRAKEDLNEHIQEILDQKTVFVPIPTDNYVIGALIGTKGSVIRDIEMETTALVFINKEMGVAEIEGGEKSIEKAKKRIERIIEEQQKLKKITREMEISTDFIRDVIGRQGLVIQRIRSISGAGIFIPRVSMAERVIVTITGTEEQIERAQMEIGLILDQINHNYRGRSPSSSQHSPDSHRSNRNIKRERIDDEEEQSYHRQR
ncbi:hypothetical protein GCK72_020149 [Caenorhabditis remanei]|uniref:K Homology domain-containing protein n=1 Tax=Caenorhabditis remanei TaxID=31234 RepID=A0A6A5GGH0_CAERE|nr:hypothetical protein GCK72_020149 [Caenorhabditis remanei]KAF1753592.1 hypothetical protein GCK72_020149 [Caenorhabditis remanei]